MMTKMKYRITICASLSPIKKKEKGKVGKTLAQVSMRINNDLYYMEVFVSTRVEKINIGVDVVAKHSKIVKNSDKILRIGESNVRHFPADPNSM